MKCLTKRRMSVIYYCEVNTPNTHDAFNSDVILAKLISSIQITSLVYILCWKANLEMTCITLLLTHKSFGRAMSKH